MTILNIPRDDLGRQRLERANALGTAAPPVTPAVGAAPPGPRAVPGRSVPLPGSAPPPERRRGERRHGSDRRAEARPVLLDTRSPYPRRTRDRRRDEAGTHAAAGLDVYS